MCGSGTRHVLGEVGAWCSHSLLGRERAERGAPRAREVGRGVEQVGGLVAVWAHHILHLLQYGVCS